MASKKPTWERAYLLKVAGRVTSAPIVAIQMVITPIRNFKSSTKLFTNFKKIMKVPQVSYIKYPINYSFSIYKIILSKLIRFII